MKLEKIQIIKNLKNQLYRRFHHKGPLNSLISSGIFGILTNAGKPSSAASFSQQVRPALTEVHLQLTPATRFAHTRKNATICLPPSAFRERTTTGSGNSAPSKFTLHSQCALDTLPPLLSKGYLSPHARRAYSTDIDVWFIGGGRVWRSL